MSAAISRRKKKGIARAGSTQGSSGRLRRASLQSLKTARPHRLFIRAGEGAATLFAAYFHDSSSSSSSSSESDEEEKDNELVDLTNKDDLDDDDLLLRVSGGGEPQSTDAIGP
ncbi:unnamed protein product, partial [Heterosigma akashiwo]